MTNVEIGRRGEDAACRFLEEKGYVVLERNYRFEKSEVDIICYRSLAGGRRGEIVFVEVKARSGDRFGAPEASVGAVKISNVVHAARAWLYEQRMESAPCRFDIVAVTFDADETTIKHYEDAFDAS
ncbi:MAG: YraN family protein [Bacteroidetes bacterium]|nr:YraN family protein [Bacteroidota bacterium]